MSNVGNKLERALSVMLTLSAVVMAGSVLHRELKARDAKEITKPHKEERWKDIVKYGRLIGDSTALVKIVVFDDLQCPFCRQFHQRVVQLQKQRPHDIAIIFVHYPLASHPYGQPAAEASECANVQGHFGEFVSTVYQKQDSLGKVSWSSMAAAAGIRDTLSFQNCLERKEKWPAIEQGLAIGREVNLKFTPTVLINGIRYYAAPDDSVILNYLPKTSSR